jgi:predicted RNase H-like nuclease (RuvC/YqgF family)
MGRRAEVAEERVFAAIKQMEEEGKSPNAGALKTFFGLGCARRYDDLLNRYLANKADEQRKAEQLEAIPLPEVIRNLMEVTISSQSANYRSDVMQIFSATTQICNERIEALKLLIDEQKSEFECARDDFIEASSKADRKVEHLEREIDVLSKLVEEKNAEINALQKKLSETQESFVSLSRYIKK